MDYKYQPEAAHRCKRDVLLCRLKNTDDPTWKRIRPRPVRNNFLGAFVLCKGAYELWRSKWGIKFSFYQLLYKSIYSVDFFSNFSTCSLPQRCRSVRSVSMGRTAHLPTVRKRLTCGHKSERALWAESSCLIHWAAQSDGHSASPDCCSSTWACLCSSVR